MPQNKISLKYSVSVTVGFVALVVAILAIAVHYISSVSLAKDAAHRQFESIADMVAQRAQITDNLGFSFTEILAQSSEAKISVSADKRHPILNLMSGAMSSSPYVSAMFIAFPNGDFVRLTNLDAAKDLYDDYGAAPEDRWIDSTNIDGKFIARYIDDKFNTRIERVTDSDYDPRVRPWFTMAQTDRITETPPFVSFGNNLLVAYVKRLDTGAVVGASFSLSYLSALLQGNYLNDGSQAFLFDNQGTVTQFEQKKIAETQGELTITGLTFEEQEYLNSNPKIIVGNMTDYPPIDFAVSGKPKGYSVDYLAELIKITGLEINFVNGVEFSELMDMFEHQNIDLMLSMFSNEERAKNGLFSNPILQTELVFVSHKDDINNYNNLNQIATKKIAIPENYSTSIYLKEHYPRYDYLVVDDPIQALRAIQNGEADVTLVVDAVAKHIEKYYYLDNLKFSGYLQDKDSLPDSAYHLYVNNSKPLLSSILKKAQQQLSAARVLDIKNKWIVNTAERNKQPPSRVQTGTLPSQILLDIALDPSKHKQLVETTLGGKRYYARVDPIGIYHPNENDHYLGVFLSESEITERFLSRVYWAVIVSVIGFLLMLPFVYYSVLKIVGPIQKLTEQSQLIEQEQYAKVKIVSTGIKELERLSLSIVNMAKTIRLHSDKNISLVSSFVRLIAKTIHSRSGGVHQKQQLVPNIAMILAKQAVQNNLPHAAAELSTESQWREFEIAAWLHDCGRVATPEHIANKKTKLEAIHNRIHEIRTRFEVLSRDAEIEMYKNILANPDTAAPHKRALVKFKKQLQQDFELITQCNLGNVDLDDKVLAQLDHIAGYRFQCQFNKYLGLSEKELENVDTTNKYHSKYEFALRDKADHIILQKAGNAQKSIYGFKLKTPSNEQNLGEIYNLKVQTGVLTDEERYVIDKQMINTLATLKELQLPEELQLIPEIVSGQYIHTIQSETLQAQKTENTSIKAKILALANVYVELIAPSVASEKAIDQQQALKEMEIMSEKGLIDKDLFALFKQAKVYELDLEGMS